MSDTSESTVVGDSDPDTLQPEATSAVILSVASTVEESEDTLRSIRKGIRAAYKLSLPPTTEPPSPASQSPGNEDKKLAYGAAKDVVDVLRLFSNIVNYTAGEGFTETAGPLAENIIETAQILFTVIGCGSSLSGPVEQSEDHTLIKIAVRQLQLQAVQRASLFPCHAEALGTSQVYDALVQIVDIVLYTRQTNSKLVSDIYGPLLPKYARSCAAFGDEAYWVSGKYISSAKIVLSDMDSGEDSGTKAAP